MIRLTIPLWVAALVVAALAPAAAADDDVGLVDVDQGRWRLQQDGGVNSFLFGNPGDLPISGDWDGDGDQTPGLYRQSDGFFYARNSNDTGVADFECFAGDPEDIPLAGDWDGDGDDTLGIYRPSRQRFFLFNKRCDNTTMGAAAVDFGFGDPGDKPVAGDWDGDGIDEVGLHRESTGLFYWRNRNSTGNADGTIIFGDPGDRFVAGEWNGLPGYDTPALFRPSDLTFYFRHTLTQGNADETFLWTGAGSGWLPVAGDFDGPPPLPPPPPPPPPDAYPTCDFTGFTVTGGKATGGVPVVKDLVVPGDQPAIVALDGPPQASGSNNFIARALDPDGNTIFDGGLAVNEGPDYLGTRVINARAGFGPVRKISVDANGDWIAEVNPVCAARTLTGTSISGVGDEIIQVNRSGTATFTHTGASNFIVFSYQNATSRQFLVNELGAFSGQAIIAPGTDFVDIHASGGGSWTFSLP